MQKSDKTQLPKIDKFRKSIFNSKHSVYTFSDINQLSSLFYKVLMELLNKDLIIPGGNLAVEFTIDIDLSFENVLLKLQSIFNLYTNICNLLKISTSHYPLTIQHLKTGSLWVKFFGESTVISLCTKLIESAISYLHRNHTIEGKINAIPKKLEALEACLEFSKKLEEAGFDTTSLNTNLNDSALVISTELNKLLSGVSKFEIDKEVYLLKNENITNPADAKKRCG